MTRYYYRAKKSSKEVQDGYVEANSQDDVINKINDMGMVVVEIQEKSAQKQSSTSSHPTEAIGARSKSTRVAVTRFYKQLSRLLQSGVPLLQALSLAGEQVTNKLLKLTLIQIKSQVSEGQSFSQTLARYPQMFPAFDSALMEAGELVGHLDTSLKRVANYRESQEKIMSKVKGALAYPVFVLAAGLIAVVYMLSFVLPKFSEFFLNLGQELPWMTRALITTSQMAEQIWPITVGVVIALILIFRASIQNNEKQLGWHRFYLSLPKVGELITYAQLSRFARTMSLLLESGIPLLKALQTTLPVLTNQSLKKELQKSTDQLKDGSTLSESFKALSCVPPFVTHLISSGESSGKLQESLDDIADWYEQELQEYVDLMTKFLEPLLILGVGLFLGLMVIAVLLPIFSMNAAVT